MPFLWASQMVNNLTANAGDKKCRFDPWVKKIPWRKAWQPIPVFASKEFHEQRSPVGYSPYGHKEVATTEATWHAHTHTHAILMVKRTLQKSVFKHQPGAKFAPSK